MPLIQFELGEDHNRIVTVFKLRNGLVSKGEAIRQIIKGYKVVVV